MTELIDLKEFLANKKIIHSETATKLTEGLTFLLENEKDADIITYNSTINFLINNVDILKINDEGNVYYEIPIERIGDIIDNIHLENFKGLNIEVCYMIGNRLFTTEKIKEFVICASIYTEFKLRLTFLEKPKNDDEFKIVFRNYLINTKDRQLLTRNPVKSEYINYIDGVAIVNF